MEGAGGSGAGAHTAEQGTAHTGAAGQRKKGTQQRRAGKALLFTGQSREGRTRALGQGTEGQGRAWPGTEGRCK